MVAENISIGRQLTAASAFVICGFAAIVAGGLLAAVTASFPSQQVVWAIAYLVLVVGIAQIGLGAGQAWLAPRSLPTLLLAAQFIAFNLGNAAVIGGTFADSSLLVDAGGAALVVSLLLFAWGLRGGAGGWLRRVCWTLLGILIVSIPIGLVLSHLRHG